MQEDVGSLNEALNKISNNYNTMLDKLYTRESASIIQEVKEVYFGDNNPLKSNNLTFELNQIFSNLEKMIVFTQKEKLNIVSKKESDMAEEDSYPAQTLNDAEMEILSGLFTKRIAEQEDYIKEMKSLATNLNSLATIHQL